MPRAALDDHDGRPGADRKEAKTAPQACRQSPSAARLDRNWTGKAISDVPRIVAGLKERGRLFDLSMAKLIEGLAADASIEPTIDALKITTSSAE